MAGRLSRRKIAGYAVDKLISGSPKKAVLREVAAYLVATRRTRELELLVRDIEDLLAQRGVVVADVISAHELTAATRAEIKKLVGADSLQLRESVDPLVLGGVRIDLPGKRFDGTILHKLTALKAKQL
jgi:F0F1-type ATP synthase delta subunit